MTNLPLPNSGFSNGAGLSILMGCHSSDDLWVATVAVLVDPAADYPTTCSVVQRSWSGVGDGDFFLDELDGGADDVVAQFEALRDGMGCTEEVVVATSGEAETCYVYPSCSEIGTLCIYDDFGHAIHPNMAALAWTGLAASQPTAGPTP